MLVAVFFCDHRVGIDAIFKKDITEGYLLCLMSDRTSYSMPVFGSLYMTEGLLEESSE